MKKLSLFFVIFLLSYTRANLLNLDIASTVQFTKQFTDLSIYKKHVDVLKYLILNISDVENNLEVYYIQNINNEVRKVFTKTNLRHSSNEVSNNEEYPEQYLIISVADYFAIIQNFFNIFIDKLKNSSHSSELCALPWADGIPQGSNLVDSLKSIEQITTGANFISLFHNILNSFRNNGCLISKNKYCDKNVTMPDELISIYHFIAAVDRKHFIMQAFVQLIKSTCNNDTSTHNLLIARGILTIRTQKYLKILKDAVSHAERGLYRCSQTLIEPHYIELERFKQTVVLPKRAHSSGNTCISTCSNINDETLSISHADYMARREYCPGRLVDCKSGGDIELCHAISGSSRLYEWIKTNSTKETYGKFSECSNSIEIMHSYQYETHSSFICEPCICTCLQDTNYSSRYGMSLKEELANIKNNEVVTGIKFVKKNKVIHPQIEIGEILPNGIIKKFSNKWKLINSINLMDNILNIYPEENLQEYVYFGSSSKDVQYINLEQIYLTDDYVLTGFKFIVVKKNSPYSNAGNNFISIAIQTTHYDIKTGKLGKYPSNWITFNPSEDEDKCRTYQHRRELKFPRSENPLKHRTLDINSINGDYVGFSASGLKEDAGQSTVPFFDATPVSGIPSFPLGGIGLYHKGLMNSGGFIAFKIAGIDRFRTINTIIPPEDNINLDSVLSSMHID